MRHAPTFQTEKKGLSIWVKSVKKDVFAVCTKVVGYRHVSPKIRLKFVWKPCIGQVKIFNL